MERKVYFDFQDGNGFIDVSSYIKYDSLKITLRAFSDNYHYAQNTASFSVIYDAAIYSKIRYNSKDIIVRILDVYDSSLLLAENNYFLTTEDGFYLGTESGGFVPRFYGHMPPSKSRVYNGILDNTIFDLEAEDDMMYLDKVVGDVCYRDYMVMNNSDPTHSIVHQLAYLAGFNSNQIDSNVNILSTPEAFVPPSPEDRVIDLLDTLLFEYGYTLNLDASGRISPIRWMKDDTSVTIQFDDTNIVQEVEITDELKQYDGTEITYYELGEVQSSLPLGDILIYRDSQLPLNDKGEFSGYSVPAGYTYPPSTYVDDPLTGQKQVVWQDYDDTGIRYWTNKAIVNKLDYNYKAFDSDYSDMVAVSDQRLEWYGDTGLVQITSFPTTTDWPVGSQIFQNRRARIAFSNPTGGPLKLYYCLIYAKVLYKTKERKSKVENIVGAKNIEQYSATFIYEKTYADALVKYLAKQQAIDLTTFQFKCEANMEIGFAARMYLNDGTDQLVLIKEKEWDEATQLWTYVTKSYSKDIGTLSQQVEKEAPRVFIPTSITSELSSYNFTSPSEADGSSPDLTNANVRMKVYKDGTDDSMAWDYSILATGVTASLGTGLNKNLLTVSAFSSNATIDASVIISATKTGYNTQSQTYTLKKVPRSKNRTYYQDAEPTGSLVVGDWWIDTNDSFKTYYYNGTAWVVDTAQANLPRFRGSLASDPASDNREGDYYYNLTSKLIRAYSGGAWAPASGNFTAAGVGADPVGTAASLVPRYRGDLASDPVTDNREGDYYYNTTSKLIRAYASSAWANASGAFTAAGVGADPTGTAAGLVPRFRGNLASDPGTDNREGDYYYNTASQKLRAYASGVWADATGKILTQAEIDARVTATAPHYLGRYLFASKPGTANPDDTATFYSATAGERGIYKWSSGAWVKQTTPTTEMIADAWADVCQIVNDVVDYGEVIEYTGSGVNFIDVLGANVAFLNKLFAQYIKIQTGGSIRGGDRYDETGATVDGTKSGFFIGASGACKVAGIEFEGSLNGGVQWGIPSLQGDTYTLAAGASGRPSIAVLNSNTVCMYAPSISGGGGRLYTYKWKGTTWETVGASFFVANTNIAGSISALNATDIALYQFSASLLQTYRWNGATWSQIGNSYGLTADANTQGALCTITSTDIAFIGRDGPLTQFYFDRYTWNGSDWSLVGTPLLLSIGPTGTKTNTICALNATSVVVQQGRSLIHYVWNGSSWAGSGGNITILSSLGMGSICALNGTDVAVVETDTNTLKLYRWNGGAWGNVTGTGTVTVSSSMTFPCLTTLNGTDIVLGRQYASFNIDFDVYRFPFSISRPYTQELTGL